MSELRRQSQTPPDAPEEAAHPGEAQGEPAPHPAASLHVFPRPDPFKEQAELRVRRRPRAMAWGPAGQDPFRRRPDAFRTNAPKPDPFARPAPAGDAQPSPAVVVPAAAAPEVLIPPGGVYIDASVSPAAPAPEPLVAPAPVRAAALATERVPVAASAAAPPVAAAAKAPPPAAPAGTLDYYGRRTGGSGGSGGDEPPRRKRFDQDDLAAAVMAIVLILLIGWGGMSLIGQDRTADDARRLLPQSAGSDSAPAPAPAPDPYAGAPVDLTPRSPAPAVPAGDPAPVPEAASPQTALAAAPQPDTAAAPGIAPTCDPGRVLRAYFCTSKADLTPQSREALAAQLAEMKSCADGREWIVRGFTDTRGTETFNTELASRRAASVAELLRSNGLTVTEIVGVGKMTDMEQGQNCANQRRVDITLKTSVPPVNRACAPLPEEEALICP